MAAPCNASHQHRGGIQCELDAGHAGLHVHGQDRGEVLYWGTTRDLSTRAELLAELATLTDAGTARPFFMAAASRDPEKVAAVRAVEAGMSARQRAILATLYGAGSGAEAGDPVPDPEPTGIEALELPPLSDAQKATLDANARAYAAERIAAAGAARDPGSAADDPRLPF